MSLESSVSPERLPLKDVIDSERRRLRRPRVLVEFPPPVPASSHPKSSAMDVVAQAPHIRHRLRWADRTAAVAVFVLVALGVLAFLGEAWAMWAMLAVAWVAAAVVVALAVGRVSVVGDAKRREERKP
jgi:hypothetical protein